MFLFLTLLITVVSCTEPIVLHDPFEIHHDGTVSALYEMINAKLPSLAVPRGVSIIFGGKVILNLRNDYRTIGDIGMTERLNDIQIIQKPIFAALLEMVHGVTNKQNIPWFNQAMDFLSDPSANDYQSPLPIERGLICDENGNLIGIDLSHLNLIGTIHLEALPQTVRSLDLSFNDLDSLNLNELRDKSVERLNVENNPRFQVNTEHFDFEPELNRTARTLYLSSYQIVPSIINWNVKRYRIERWLHRQPTIETVVLDSALTICREGSVPFYVAMVNVIKRVTNKERIPWYQHFLNSWTIHPSSWCDFGVIYHKGNSRSRARLSFDLSGLGLEGHIDLGHTPRNVMRLDLSNNNLSSISFIGKANCNLQELNLQNNDNLRIDLTEIDQSSKSCCLYYLKRLMISSNQINRCRMSKRNSVYQWLSVNMVKEVVLDEVVLRKDMMYRSRIK